VEFLRLWATGYRSPARFIEALKHWPAPQTGALAQLIRVLLDGLVLYLPLALMGRQPSTPSSLSFLPTEDYYWHSVWLAPVVLLAQWLFLSAALHLLLRLFRQPSDIDQILNINGTLALVVGAVILAWDWIYVAAGWRSDVVLGISHLVILIWGMSITVLGYRRILGLRTGVAIGVTVLWVALGEPVGALFLRAPV
jgi:hypothetical protein